MTMSGAASPERTQTHASTKAGFMLVFLTYRPMRGKLGIGTPRHDDSRGPPQPSPIGWERVPVGRVRGLCHSPFPPAGAALLHVLADGCVLESLEAYAA